MRPRILLIGLPGARWAGLHRLIDAERVPAIAKIVETGTIAELDLAGYTQSAIWASFATGVVPIVHGITAGMEMRPDGGGIQPIGATSWRSRPFWQILAERGIACATFGWPGLVPATAWRGTAWPGTVIDERFAQPAGTVPEDWPLAPECVAPATLRRALRALRIHPDDLDEADCRGITPAALAHAATVQAAAVMLAAQDDWQVLSVFQPLLALVPDGDAADDSSNAAAGFVDASLARLIALAGPATDVVLVSDTGVFAAAGPGFARDVTRHRAAAPDIAATILARFGLTIEGGAGTSLLAREGACMIVSGHVEQPMVAAQPVAPPPSEETAQLIRAVGRDTDVHAATAALAIGDYAGAARLLEALLTVDPTDDDARALLGQCRFFQGDLAGCGAIGAALLRARPNEPWGAMMFGASLALSGKAAQAAPYLAAAKRLAGGNADAHIRLGAIALHIAHADEAAEHYADALALAPNNADARAGLGLAALAAKDLTNGERHLRTALGLRFHAPALHHQLGLLFASQGRYEEAEHALRIALGQNPQQHGVAALLARVEQAVSPQNA